MRARHGRLRGRHRQGDARAELEYEWVAELVADPDDEAEVSGLVRTFHTFLDEGGHRALLRREGGDSRLRAVVRELKRRRAGH